MVCCTIILYISITRSIIIIPIKWALINTFILCINYTYSIISNCTFSIYTILTLTTNYTASKMSTTTCITTWLIHIKLRIDIYFELIAITFRRSTWFRWVSSWICCWISSRVSSGIGCRISITAWWLYTFTILKLW